MAKRREAISGSLGVIAEHPSMQMTPEHFGARIKAAALAARRVGQDCIEQGYKVSRQASQELRAALAQARTADEQRRRLWQGIGGGELAGILLWSFLPGPLRGPCPNAGIGPSAWRRRRPANHQAGMQARTSCRPTIRKHGVHLWRPLTRSAIIRMRLKLVGNLLRSCCSQSDAR